MTKKDRLKVELEAHKRVKQELTKTCDKCGKEFPFDEVQHTGYTLCNYHYVELCYVISKYMGGTLRK